MSDSQGLKQHWLLSCVEPYFLFCFMQIIVLFALVFAEIPTVLFICLVWNSRREKIRKKEKGSYKYESTDELISDLFWHMRVCLMVRSKVNVLWYLDVFGSYMLPRLVIENHFSLLEDEIEYSIIMSIHVSSYFSATA